MALTNNLRDFRGYRFAFCANSFCTQTLGKTQILRQRALIFGAFVHSDIYVDHIEIGIDTLRHASGPRDKVLGCGI